ncbi:MAG: sugar ABC transporter permease [Spirochaetaceae bacterium]|nr:MAG: sugar ABC transporter permease [Spirochaetaceae bacterium]
MYTRGFSRYPIEWLFPVLILVIIFTVFPFGYAIWNSLFQILLVLPIKPFVGIQNYIDVVSSPYFWEALVNTLVITGITAPITVIIALGVARLLLTKFVGRSIVRAVVLLPWAMPGVVSGTVWVWIFHGQWGVLNSLLMKLGIIDNYIQWLNTPNLARIAVMVAHIWTQIPFASVLLMAALTTINKEIYEAAEVDGAGPARRLFSVTIPQIKAILLIAFIYELIIGLTSYDLTYAMTRGGPGGATTLLSYYIWAESFKMLHFGRGAALGVIVALITLGLILAILRAVPGEITVEE